MSASLKEAVAAALAPVAADMAAVEHIIAAEMESDIPRVKEIGRYITSAGGKRMRPALLILMARAMGDASDNAPYFGAVIEILHTATLMHDDVVDEGRMRRGRETANARWDNNQAVLVGDFLYTRAFQMMIRRGNLGVMKALADAANRLSEGEVLQLTNAGDPKTTEERYFAVIERKTACLFEAAAHMAAAFSGAPQEYEEACARYALHLGNAFQIADDILDYQGEAEAIGKNLGADLKEGKVTLPVIYALQRCSAEDRALIEQAILTSDGDFAAISRIVKRSGAIERCYERALVEVEKGKNALNALPTGQFRNSLIKFLSFAVERDR